MNPIQRALAAEPVAFVGLLESVAALVLTFTDILTPEQLAAIIGVIVATHAVIRQLVVSPRTDAQRSAAAVAEAQGE